MGKRRVRVDVWCYLPGFDRYGQRTGQLEAMLEASRTFMWHWQAKEFMAKYPPTQFAFVVTKG